MAQRTAHLVPNQKVARSSRAGGAVHVSLVRETVCKTVAAEFDSRVRLQS